MLLLSSFFKGAFLQEYSKDVFPATAGNIEITFIAHATLMIQYNGKVYHIDPVTMFGTDYTKMPKADVILITHSHSDHMDAKAVANSTDGKEYTFPHVINPPALIDALDDR